ncbi:hypothetical protein, partial [Streptomyces sp. rh195]|uniref:hypothetical protein n=1 Tax=Streptomyces sp. rh195 TaxID=2034271 RepID=UPI00211D21F8
MTVPACRASTVTSSTDHGPGHRRRAQGAPQETAAESGPGGAARQAEPGIQQGARRRAFVVGDGVRGCGPPGDAQGEHRVPAGSQQGRHLGVGAVRRPARGLSLIHISDGAR